MQSTAHQRRSNAETCEREAETGGAAGGRVGELCESRENRAFSPRAEVTINPEEDLNRIGGVRSAV